MAGGQVITSGQGFLLVPRSRGQAAVMSAGSVGLSVTIALVGAAIALSQGAATPNSNGNVPLTGSASTMAQGAAGPAWGQALTGSESTSAHGTATPGLRPTDVLGQAITTGQGTAAPAGSGGSAHLSGVEATFVQGSVGSGTQALSGQAITPAAGSTTQSLTLSISGSEFAVAQGILAPEQAADDTAIVGNQGTAAAVASVALTGSASTSATGSVTVSGDAFIALTGSASTSAAGTIVHEEAYGLTGVQSDSAQYNVGAPGGATLSGSVSSVIAGTVHITNDRDYALTGISTTLQDGSLFASPLAFVDGLELASGLQDIGPREVTLVGITLNVGQGELTLPRVGHTAAAAPQKKRFEKPATVRITLDEEEFTFAYEALAENILRLAAEYAQKQVKPPFIVVDATISNTEKREIRQAFLDRFYEVRASLKGQKQRTKAKPAPDVAEPAEKPPMTRKEQEEIIAAILLL